jgi:D-arabinose 1-dehydrogenase-like Zn-dependent alcohol dehydrogenase
MKNAVNKSFVAGHPSAFLGHEAAGEIVEIAQPGPLNVGDRVVMMPSYACGQCALTDLASIADESNSERARTIGIARTRQDYFESVGVKLS